MSTQPKGPIRKIAGWRGFRPFRFLRLTWLRGLRRRGSPHQMALGMALGVLIGVSPAWGLHTWIGLLCGLVLPVNPFAVVIGTWIVGNPITFPFIIGGEIWIGDKIVSVTDPKSALLMQHLHEVHVHSEFWDLMRKVPKILVYGSAALGGVLAGITYGITYSLVLRWNLRRANRAAHARWIEEAPTEIHAPLGPRQP